MIHHQIILVYSSFYKIYVKMQGQPSLGPP